MADPDFFLLFSTVFHSSLASSISSSLTDPNELNDSKLSTLLFMTFAGTVALLSMSLALEPSLPVVVVAAAIAEVSRASFRSSNSPLSFVSFVAASCAAFIFLRNFFFSFRRCFRLSSSSSSPRPMASLLLLLLLLLFVSSPPARSRSPRCNFSFASSNSS